MLDLPCTEPRLVVADLAQIEARALVWAGGQWDVVEAFERYDAAVAAGEPEDVIKKLDIYTVNGAKMNMDRQGGKVATLSCFGADTQVLVKKGLDTFTLPIVEVTSEYQVWDGVEWVSTAGAIARGRRSTIVIGGVAVTPDHALLCGETWKPASEVRTCASTLTRALATGSANLPSEVLSSVFAAGFSASSCSARAAHHATKPASATSDPGAAPGACVAPRSLRVTPAPAKRSGICDTLASCLTTSIAAACSTASRLLCSGATILGAKIMPDTAGAASSYTRRGALPTAALTSCATYLRSTGGTTRTSSWTGETTTGGTSRATFGLSSAERTPETNAPSPVCSVKSTVYDLTLCGPRQRFTVWTSLGPLIAHNCGYQAGRFTVCVFAKTYGLNLTEEQGQAIVTAWREANPMVVRLWKAEEDAAKAAIENPGVPQDRGKLGAYLFNGQHLLRKLPSGRCICYRNATLEMKQTPWGQRRRVVGYDANYFAKNSRTFVRLKAYGGLFVENLIQAMCRDILAVGIYRAERAGLQVILHVHDEIGVRSTQPAVDGVLLVRAMTSPIPWCRGLPIASSVDVLTRYRKA